MRNELNQFILLARRLSIFFIIFIISGCQTLKLSKAPEIMESQNLFRDISYLYPIEQYSVTLKTKDAVFYLKNPSVLPNGIIEAEISTKTKDGKKMLFFSKNKNQTIKKIIDTTGADRNLVQFSEDGVTKVIIKDRTEGKNRNKIYDEYYITKRIIFTLLYLLYGVLIFLLFIKGVNWVLGGCFIATMVYGSYDAPEVLVLRKFRDDKLARNLFGRIFIRIYYWLSPSIVCIFKNNKPVNKFIKSILDKWVRVLVKKELIKEGNNCG